VTVSWASLYVLLGAPTRLQAISATVLFLLGAAVAASSRGDAAAYVVLVGFAVCVLRWRDVSARPWRLVVPVVAAAAGLVSFIGAQQTQVLSGGFEVVVDRPTEELWFRNLTELPALVIGVFGVGPLGNLGWFDTGMPAVTTISAALVAGGLLFAGFGAMTARKGIALAVVGAGLLAIPLYLLQISRNVVGENLQPRYLLPLVPALLGLALSGRGGDDAVRPTRGQAVLAYALLVIAQSMALHATMRRFVTGSDVGVFNLEPTEWWWNSAPSPMVVWALGTGAFAVLATAVLLVSAPGEDWSPKERTAADRPTGGRSAAAEPADRLARGRVTYQAALLEDEPP